MNELCRVCLSDTVQHIIVNTNLQAVYEKLTQIPINNNRPLYVCYICYARLNNSYKLMLQCVKTDNILRQMMSRKEKVKDKAKFLDRMSRHYSRLCISSQEQYSIENEIEDADNEKEGNYEQDDDTEVIKPPGMFKHKNSRPENDTKIGKGKREQNLKQSKIKKKLDCINTSPSVIMSNEAEPSTSEFTKEISNFLSDEEVSLASEFVGVQTDLDAWNETDSREEDHNLSIKRPRKTINTVEPDKQENGSRPKRKNLRAERKKLKDTGQEYTQTNGRLVESKKVQPNPCVGKKCGNNCGAITEDKRRLIFEHYWKLSLEQRKEWIMCMSQKTAIKRKRVIDSQRRTVTYKYFINEGEAKIPVCLQFLALTIDVSQRFIYYTVRHFGNVQDMRFKREPPNKTKESTKNTFINFIKRLPAVPSLYSRKGSDRMYLPHEFKNYSNLYQIYKKDHTERGIEFVSERVFRYIFKENFNIGFHVPKKDKIKCLKCLKNEKSCDSDPNIEADRLEHENDIENSNARYKAHQNVYKTDPSTLCVSFDFEKTLNTPYENNNVCYYSRKLAIYNFCIYENGTRNIYYYYWDESNGTRGSNEIASLLNRYIKIVDKRGTIKNLILYCVCCPRRNRNMTTLAMIHATLQFCKNINTIQINYLPKGHSYMPMDSVHSVLEKNLKNRTIYAPSQWYTVLSMARQDPMPFNVEMMSYKDFQKWDAVSEEYFKDLTGRIDKVRVATFEKGVMGVAVKYSMSENEKQEKVQVQCNTITLPSSYVNLLPISEAKFRDLDKLCKDKVIPTAFHFEYVNIPFARSVKDTLPDTDIEDDIE